ncbi:hypothetical protein [Terrabacter aeriphilus]|uniref:hypothetical protein n=1 Tax=Terrabacter aeriphilus TaxID=515662 RepID=UPI0031E5C6B9
MPTAYAGWQARAVTHLVRPAGPDDLAVLPALEQAADEVCAASGWARSARR